MSSEASSLTFDVPICLPSQFCLFTSSLLDIRSGLPVSVLSGLGEAGTGHSSGPAGSAGGAGHQGNAGSQGAPEPRH